MVYSSYYYYKSIAVVFFFIIYLLFINDYDNNNQHWSRALLFSMRNNAKKSHRPEYVMSIIIVYIY